MKICHPDPPEKRRNKVNYLTWNFTSLKFVKKTNKLNCPGYVNCYSSSKLRPVKSPNNSIRYNCNKICSWLRRSKTILEIRKNTTFLQVINNSIFYKFFKDLYNHRKKTNSVVVFSCRPFPTFLKTGTTMKPSNNLGNQTPSDTYW